MRRRPSCLTSSSPQDESVRLAEKGLLDPPFSIAKKKCSREDSNLHGLPHTVLSRTRLPVPPRELEKLAEAS